MSEALLQALVLGVLEESGGCAYPFEIAKKLLADRLNDMNPDRFAAIVNDILFVLSDLAKQRLVHPDYPRTTFDFTKPLTTTKWCLGWDEKKWLKMRCDGAYWAGNKYESEEERRMCEELEKEGW